MLNQTPMNKIRAQYYLFLFRVWQIKGRILRQRAIRASHRQAEACTNLAIYTLEMQAIEAKLLQYGDSLRDAKESGGAES